MADEPFTEPDETDDDWVDVHMTDPEQGEWDVDVVVADGQVEYLDLRVRPELLAGFVDCLVDDIGDARGRDVLRDVAERQDIDMRPTEE